MIRFTMQVNEQAGNPTLDQTRLEFSLE